MKKSIWILVAVAVVAAGVAAALILPGVFRTGRIGSLLEQASEAESRNDSDAALGYYAQILALSPDHPEALSRSAAIRREAGARAMSEGDYDSAAAEFEQLVRLSGEEENYMLLAQSYAACGDRDNAFRMIAELSGRFDADRESVIGTLFEIQTEREPNCVESGTVLYRSRIGTGAFSETVPPTGEHSWDGGTVQTEPTCVNDGVRLFTCTVCGETRTESIEKTGIHSFAEKVTQEPTCSEEGILLRMCTVCSLREEETIPATGEHLWKETVTREATCSESGTKRRECTVCGKAEETVLPPTGDHRWTETVTKEATCASTGILLKTCSVCGLKQEEVIPLSGEHTWREAVTKQPTCADPGEKKVTCSVCGKTYTESVPATGNHTWKETSVQQPDCVHDGRRTLTCSVCGKAEQETLPATGVHAFGGWTVSVPATVSSEGIRTRTCAVCGAEETESIPKTAVSGALQELPGTSYYGYTCLQKKGTGYVGAYLAIAECISKMDKEADIRDFRIPTADADLLFECLERDFPQYFWLDKRYSYQYSADGYLISFSPDYLCSSSEKAKLQQKFEDAVSSVLSGLGSSMSPYELALEIHERIIARAAYDTSQAAPFTHSAYGNLVNRSSVCEGYSKAFQYLMYRCGICATTVPGKASGGAHSWNVVWLDGVPYEVDCTFDDPVSSGDSNLPIHEYFLQTTAYMESTGRKYDSTRLPRVSCTATRLNYFIQNGTAVPLTASALAEVFGRYSGETVSIEVLLDRIYSMKEIAAFLDSYGDDVVGERFSGSGYYCTYSLSSSGRDLRLIVWGA